MMKRRVADKWLGDIGCQGPACGQRTNDDDGRRDKLDIYRNTFL